MLKNYLFEWMHAIGNTVPLLLPSRWAARMASFMACSWSSWRDASADLARKLVTTGPATTSISRHRCC